MDDIIQSFPCHPEKGTPSARAIVLTQCCSELFFEIAVKYPLMLKEAFTVDQFAALQCCCGAYMYRPQDPIAQSPFFHFLGSLASSSHADRSLITRWILPIQAITFVKFLSSTDLCYIRYALEDLLSAIHKATAHTPRRLIPLLCFALHLCYESPLASRLAVDLGLLHLLGDIHTRSINHREDSLRRQLLTGCTLVYAAVGLHVPFEDMDVSILYAAIRTWVAHSASPCYLQDIQDALDTTSDCTVNRYAQAQWLSLCRFFLSASSGSDVFDFNPWKVLLSSSIFT